MYYNIFFYFLLAKLIRYSQRMKEYSITLNFKNFLKQNKLYSIIGDQAHYIVSEQPLKIGNFIIELFNPHNNFCISLMLMKFTLILFELFTIPLETTFWYEKGKQTPVYYDFYLFSILIFCSLEMLLTFNTGIYIEGFIIKDRKQIALNYIFGSFIFDAIGIASIILTFITKDHIYLYLFLIHIFQIYSIFNNIDNLF